MERRITTRSLPSHPDRQRCVPSHALHQQNRPSLRRRRAHHERRQRWVTDTIHPRQRSLLLLHLHVPPHREGTILRELQGS